jgi:hypothetical protein
MARRRDKSRARPVSEMEKNCDGSSLAEFKLYIFIKCERGLSIIVYYACQQHSPRLYSANIMKIKRIFIIVSKSYFLRLGNSVEEFVCVNLIGHLTQLNQHIC